MKIGIQLLDLVKNGEFSIGISGCKHLITGHLYNEETEDINYNEEYIVGEMFLITISLFIIDIYLHLNEQIYEEPTKIKD